MYYRLSSSAGNSTAGAKFPNSRFFLLPKGIPQLLANVVSVSVAVNATLEGTTVLCEEPEPSGDGRGIWYEAVLRL